MGLLSVLVVLAMVAVAIFSRQAADSHRRAQVLAEQLRASSEEMSALKWRANTQLLNGTADFSTTGTLVSAGARILSQLHDEASEYQRVQPGADARRLRDDVQELISGSIQGLDGARGAGAQSRSTQAQMQNQFQPILDRMDVDAQRAARHQQAVATAALASLLWVSIGSLLLGVCLLAVLGWRLASLRRRTVLAEEIRAVERRSEQRIRELVEHSSDVVTLLGRDLRVRWQAASVRGMLGIEPGSLVDAPITSIAHPEDGSRFESFLQARVDGGAPASLRIRLRHAEGHWVHTEIVAANRFANPAIGGLVLNMRDISERIAFEDQLRNQAFRDSLTGLANRALFENRLRHALAAGLRTHRPLAVLFLDLDDFKTINDSLGHGAGDLLLERVAARIDPLVRPSDTAARLGGDEFAVLLDGVDSTAGAAEVAERILAAVGDPIIDRWSRAERHGVDWDRCERRFDRGGRAPAQRRHGDVRREGEPARTPCVRSSRRCIAPPLSVSSCAPSFRGLWRTRSCVSSTSRSSHCRRGGSSVSRRSCAGTIRPAAGLRPCSSSAWRRRPGS